MDLNLERSCRRRASRLALPLTGHRNGSENNNNRDGKEADEASEERGKRVSVIWNTRGIVVNTSRRNGGRGVGGLSRIV